MQIDQYIDVDKLTQYIDEGIVDQRRHPSLPLSILCYSRRAVFEDLWDEVTELTRGLIVADDGEVVSRPFSKFFNLDTSWRPETHLSNIPLKTEPIITDKLDGSLGILWEYDGQTGIASKGSFTSDHATWATAWYKKNCPNPQWPLGYTPVFEMICQSVQQHVVYYQLADQLILLALVRTDTGEEADYNTVYHYAYLNGLKTTEVFSKTIGDVINEDRPNKEGYVLTWPREGTTPLKIKVKHETFLRLQKIVHNATPKNILEELSKGNYPQVDEWESSTSPELSVFIKSWAYKFVTSYGVVLNKVKHIVNNAVLRYGDNRKAVAEFFMNDENNRYASCCFAAYDNKDVSKPAWRLVEEAYKEELNRPVMGDPEDDGDKE